jgi:hypothetical protein
VLLETSTQKPKGTEPLLSPTAADLTHTRSNEVLSKENGKIQTLHSRSSSEYEKAFFSGEAKQIKVCDNQMRIWMCAAVVRQTVNDF